MLSVLAAARLGSLPCERGECSGCRKLAAEARAVEPSEPEPASPPPAEVLAGWSPPEYAPTHLPELSFSNQDGRVLQAVNDGVHEDARLWRLNLDANRLALESGFEELRCLPLVRGVKRFEYQVATALKVLRDLRGRALLADEVGLGKTIEASLVLKEYVLRGLVRSALILVPAGLVVQWQEELSEKFGLSFEILDDVEDWERHRFVIASLDTAKRAKHREIAERIVFDLVIVDEAHKLRNRRTKNWKFVNALRKKYILMLTATPVQNDLEELFNLVTLLKPGQLSTWKSFRKEFFAKGDRRTPENPAALRSLLLEVMIRNRRGDALVLPPRRVDSVEVPLAEDERALYDGVSDFVRRWYGSTTLANRLSCVVLQREIGSSPAAAAGTLRKLRTSPNYSWEEQAELDGLYQKAVAVRDSERGERLLDLVEEVPEKVLVFTQYHRTMTWLAEKMRERGISHVTFHGGMRSAEKEDSVRGFREDAQVFLSTEAGGEGRNLQFASRVVNFDLPWNPLRLEQRIGRVHRVGQDRAVYVANLWARDTIEEYVIELLDKKIRMFELVIGELDMVLGNLEETRSFEDLLLHVWILPDLVERRAALERLGDSLVAARESYVKTKSYEDGLFGDDFAVGARS